MAAGHRSPTSHSKNTDKNLEEAQNTGYLDLSSRKLVELPKAIDSYDLTDTVEADISKNRLTELPNEICSFVLLEKLNCYSNSIRSLPHSFVNLKYLTYLDISRNQLSQLPELISELISLEVLLVSNNRLVSIPEEISELQSLMELDLSCNEISVLPSQIGSLINLRILNLRKNCLLELPSDISLLKLKTLDFSCNKIQAIPTELRVMESLEELLIDNNPLIMPPAHICTKGRVHILKYLQLLTMKEDKKRGVLTAVENNFSRNSLQRSFHRDDTDAVRLRRKGIISGDSGYGTDSPNRWTAGYIENGFESTLRAPEVIKEQRQERHQELQRRILQTELHSPSNRSNLTIPSSMLSPGHASDTSIDDGSISPLRVSPGKAELRAPAASGGDDIFSKELARQQQEYDIKRKRAEQLRAEDRARRSGKSPSTSSSPPPQQKSPPSNQSMSPESSATCVYPNTASVISTTVLPGNSKPPQVPVRSASVHLPSRNLLYSEQPMSRPNYLSIRGSRQMSWSSDSDAASHGQSNTNASNYSLYVNYNSSVIPQFSNNTPAQTSRKDEHEQNTNGSLADRNSVSSLTPDSRVTERTVPSDSPRSSPVSHSSQDDELKTPSSQESASRLRAPRSTTKYARDSIADFVQRKLRSRSTPSIRDKMRPVAVTPTTSNDSQPNKSGDSSKLPSKSNIPSGKISSGIQTACRALKSQGRSKTAPIPTISSSSNHGDNSDISSSNLSRAHNSTSSNVDRSKGTPTAVPTSNSRLPVKASLNTESSIPTRGQSSSSKFGFQPQPSVGSRSSPLATNGNHQGPENTGVNIDETEAVARIREIIESRLKLTLSKDVMSEIRDGVVLCHLVNHIKARTVSQIHVKSTAVPKLSMAKCKRNVESFLDACRRLGVAQESLCTNADILDDKRPIPVLMTLQALIDVKTVPSNNNKPVNGVSSSAARPRTTSGSRTPTSHLNKATPTSKRSSQPMHSFV